MSLGFVRERGKGFGLTQEGCRALWLRRGKEMMTHEHEGEKDGEGSWLGVEVRVCWRRRRLRVRWGKQEDEVMVVGLQVVGLVSRFKDSAESETSRPSRIRLGPLRDESESRVGQLNSEETDSAENRS